MAAHWAALIVRRHAHRRARREVVALRDDRRLIGSRREAQYPAAARSRTATDERRTAMNVDVDGVQGPVGCDRDAEWVRAVGVLPHVLQRLTGNRSPRRRAVVAHPHDRRITDDRADRPAVTRRVTRDTAGEWEERCIALYERRDVKR